jgi:hypothetical protein
MPIDSFVVKALSRYLLLVYRVVVTMLKCKYTREHSRCVASILVVTVDSMVAEVVRHNALPEAFAWEAGSRLVFHSGLEVAVVGAAAIHTWVWAAD